VTRAGDEQGRFRRLVLSIGLPVLAAVVAGLTLTALQVGAKTQVPRGPEMEPLAVPDAPGTPAPELTEQLTLLPSGDALSVTVDGVLWRTTAASCAPGAAGDPPPTFERSEDGLTWVDVTPAGADVREVVWLQGIDRAAAEVVALTGPTCAPQVLRSFTLGAFWEPYPESLTGATTVDAAAGLLRTSERAASLPCDPPFRVVTGTELPTVVCPGTLARLAGADWSRLALDNLVAASGSLADGVLFTAREATAGCSGILIERWSAQEEKLGELCRDFVGVRAISADPSRVWVWSEGGVESLTW